jgi:HSP20 family molecular chaperone IbpA
LKKDDITVELSGNELVVTGDLKDGADGQSSHRIRRSGHVEQRVLLPASAEADKVTASLSDGVLTVTVSKSEGQIPPSGRGHLRLSRTSAHAAGTVPGRMPRGRPQ